MSIELKQAAKRAIEMLTASSTFFSTRSALMTDECRAAAEALRTAIQQAEAMQAEVTDEEIDYAVLQTVGFDGMGMQEMNQFDCRNIARAILTLRPTTTPGYWTSVRHELPTLVGDSQHSRVVQLAVAVDASSYPTEQECANGKVCYVTRYESTVGRLCSPRRDVSPGDGLTYHWRDIESGKTIENVAFWAPLQSGPADLVLVGQQARLSHWSEKGPHHVLSRLTCKSGTGSPCCPVC